MTKPAVSIITPIRARHAAHVRWLVELVTSIQGQTRDDWELVIVDDHSKVALPTFDDERVRVVEIDDGASGVSAARNQAARLATSDLLLPVDADDKLSPDAVETFLAAWPGKGIVYSDVMMFGTDFARAKLAPEYDFDTLLRATFMLVGCLHLKADWERVGGWRDDMQVGLEDWEYWIALGELGVCGKRVAEPLYWYRRQPGGRLAALKADPQKWHRAYNRMRELHRETYNGRRPVGCCGGSAKRVSGVVNRSKPLAPAPTVTGARDLVIYTGSRTGQFGLRGRATGVRYMVPGRGDFVVDQDGKPGVDKKDTQLMLQLGNFQIVKPPATPATAPVPAKAPTRQVPPATPSTSEAWKPDLMDSAPTTATELHEASIDPGALSVREIKELDLTPAVAAQMLTAERDGKARSTVIAHLEKKAP